MNHNNLVGIVSRVCIVWVCITSAAISHGMENGRLLGNGDFENNHQDVDFTYEQHPVLTQQFKDFMFGDQATSEQLKKIFDTEFVWSMHDGQKVNNACGLACIAVLEGDHKRARELFEDAADQGSFWAMHSSGIYQLGDLNISKASSYFQQAYENNSCKIAKDRGLNNGGAIWSHRQVMALLGFPAQKKFNFLSMLDERIIHSSGKKMGDFAYPLAICARDVGDVVAQEMCLEEAIKQGNQFSVEALLRRNSLNAKKDQQIQPPAVPTLIDNSSANSSSVPMASEVKIIVQEPQSISAINSVDSNPSTQQASDPLLAVAITPIDSNAPAPQTSDALPVEPTVKQIDYTKMSDKQLQQAKAANGQKLRASTDDSQARIERALIDEARLAKAKNDSQRIPILKEMAQYGHVEACYQLAAHYGNHASDASRIQQRWDLLKTAADNDHLAACYEFIIEGFSSEKQERKEAAAAYADRMLNDQIRMARINFSNEQLGLIYRGYGAYFTSIRHDEKAIEFFQKAIDHGDLTYAYTLAELYENKGDFAKANAHYALVTGDKKVQATWNNRVLEYGSTKDTDTRKKLLAQWSKQCIGNDTHVLLHSAIASRLKHDRVQAQLIYDSNNGSELASFVLAFCAQNEIMQAGIRPLSNMAFDYCMRSITQSEKGSNAECKEASRLMMQQLAAANNKEAELYLRKVAPTNEQKALDLLYRGEVPSRALSTAEFSVLKKDTESADTERALHAHALIAAEYVRQGDEAKVKKQDDKAYGFYKKAVESLRAGLRYNGSDAHPARSKMCALLPSALTALAQTTKNNQEQAGYYKEAADDKNPSAQACIWMYRHGKGAVYLDRAVDANNPESLLLQAQEIFKQDPKNVKVVDRVDAALKLIEHNNNCLNDELKRELYRLKLELSADNAEKMKWRCKMVEAGDSQWAFDVAQLQIKLGEYQKALNALEIVDPEHARNEHLPLLKKYTYHLLAPADASKRNEVFKECVCILRGALNKPLDQAATAMMQDIFATMNPSEKNKSIAEIETLMLQEYEKNNYRRISELSALLGDNNATSLSILAYTADQVIEVTGAADPGKTFEKALKSLALEQCPQCRKHARVQVYNMLKKATYAISPNDDLAALLKVIFEGCAKDQDTSEQALFVEGQVAAALAACAYKKQDAEALNRVHGKIPMNEPQRKLYSAFLLDHNKSGDGAANGALVIYTQLADGGDPEAQRILTSRYLYGVILPSGVGFADNFPRAKHYALLLSQNKQASISQRAVAHEVLAISSIRTIAEKNAAIEQLLFQNKSSKQSAQKIEANQKLIKEYVKDAQESFNFGDGCSGLALRAEHYQALALCLELYALISHTAELIGNTKLRDEYKMRAELCYGQYVDRPKLWKQTASALPFVKEVMTSFPVHTRCVMIEKLLPNVPNMQLEGPVSADRFVNDVNEIVNRLKMNSASYQAYGFKSEQEMQDAANRLERELIPAGKASPGAFDRISVAVKVEALKQQKKK